MVMTMGAAANGFTIGSNAPLVLSM